MAVRRFPISAPNRGFHPVSPYGLDRHKSIDYCTQIRRLIARSGGICYFRGIEFSRTITYNSVMPRSIAARLPCSVETRDEVLKPLKRADETYDELLQSMAEQYDPDAAHDPSMVES